MSEALTRPDRFHPSLRAPMMWSGQKPSDVQETNPGYCGFLTAATISLMAMSHPQTFALPSSAAGPGISLEEVRSGLQNSPAALTRKSIGLKINDFHIAFNESVEMSKAMVADDEGAPLNVQTWRYAAQEIISIISSLDIPLPFMLPLQNGGMGAEWHAKGLNIELRFRKPYQVYVVLEDARNTIPELHGYDRNLVQAREALRQLSARNLA